MRPSPFRIALLFAAAVTPLTSVSAQRRAEAPPPPPKVDALDSEGEPEGGEPTATAAPCESEDDPRPHCQPPVGAGLPSAETLAESRRGRYRHDGALLRLSLGPDGGWFTLRSNPELEIRGIGLTVSLDLGYALDRNWVLHLRYATSNILSGRAWLGGMEVGQAESPFAAGQMIGVAGTYYLMPENIFATLTLGLGTSTMQVDGFSDTDTDVGYALCVDGGKEWWVGSDLAVGVALRVWLSAMAAESGANVVAPLIGLVGTATYQ
ncbi:MAG: hypothetical protein PVI30_03730 [Myxococcales bacterium]|jgi:hypothetical protein